jgi:hypothetical protein
MVRSISAVSVPVFILLAGAAAQGQTILHTFLSNGAENPPAVPTLQNGDPRPASFGEALLVLNAAQTELTMTMTIHNIDFTGSQTTDSNDNLLAAHIHAGPNVTPSTNGPVVWGFIGTPFNDTNPTDTVVTPFATGVGATITSKWDAPEGNNTTLTAQLSNLLNDRAYLNFHTVQFGGGEIRGNIDVVPEPASGLLVAGGALALAIRRRSR